MPRNLTSSSRKRPASGPAKSVRQPSLSGDAAPVEHAGNKEQLLALDHLTKLDRLVAMLQHPAGATLSELASVTGWQAHSIRGALAGSLKRKGHSVLSERIEGLRRYRIKVVP